MEKKIDSSGMLEKIRAAGCLTDAELETAATCFAAMDTRQKIDALDERWASDIRKYVQRHTRKGGGVTVSLPTEEDGWALTFIGGALICFGVFMLSQLKFDTQFEYLPALFFAFIGFLGGAGPSIEASRPEKWSANTKPSFVVFGMLGVRLPRSCPPSFSRHGRCAGSV